MRTTTILATLTLLFGSLLVAQDKKAAQAGTDKATKSRGKGSTQDPNIKGGSDVNRANANLPAPPNKGGSARTGVCAVQVDNRTSLNVKIYVDGDYKGVIGPYGDAVTYALAGATRLYGRADFDDGTSSTFGPRVINCSGVFQWSLYP